MPDGYADHSFQIACTLTATQQRRVIPFRITAPLAPVPECDMASYSRPNCAELEVSLSSLPPNWAGPSRNPCTRACTPGVLSWPWKVGLRPFPPTHRPCVLLGPAAQLGCPRRVAKQRRHASDVADGSPFRSAPLDHPYVLKQNMVMKTVLGVSIGGILCVLALVFSMYAPCCMRQLSRHTFSTPAHGPNGCAWSAQIRASGRDARRRLEQE